MYPIVLLVLYLTAIAGFYRNIRFFEGYLGKASISIAIIVFFFIDIKLGLFTLLTILAIYKYEYQYVTMHSYIINLDKNENRFKGASAEYEASDLNDAVPLDRFSAVNGKQLILSDYISEDIVKEIQEVQETGSRTYHHQLTRGGVGCFFSHLTLYRQLVEDKSYNAYLIMEDDIKIARDIKTHIDYSLKNIPTDWDIILYSWLREGSQPTLHPTINKVDYFWGMQCYLINRRGAEKIIRELENQPIDGQIDSYLSRMVKQGKLNIYMYNKKVVNENSNQTDIQMDMKYSTDIDPFDYKGYIMR